MTLSLATSFTVYARIQDFFSRGGSEGYNYVSWGWRIPRLFSDNFYYVHLRNLKYPGVQTPSPSTIDQHMHSPEHSPFPRSWSQIWKARKDLGYEPCIHCNNIFKKSLVPTLDRSTGGVEKKSRLGLVSVVNVTVLLLFFVFNWAYLKSTILSSTYIYLHVFTSHAYLPLHYAQLR